MSNARKLGNMTTHGLDGDFNVDPTDNTLVVDSTNNRVGIGSATPTTTLDITGTATATAFAGPLTGNVTGTTSSISNHNTDALTEGSTNLYFTNARADARAQLKIDALVDSAPNTLDTLNELAAALGDDANFSTTITNSIATKLPLAGGTVTGALIVAAGDNGLDVRVGTDKRILFAGNIGEIGSVAGFQAVNTAGNANTAFGIRATDIRFATGSDERVRITDTGVGIGTDSPDAILDVRGGAASRPTFIHASGYGGIQIAGTGASSGGALIFSNDYNTSVSEEYSIFLDGATDDLVFISGDPADIATEERMRLTDDSATTLLIKAKKSTFSSAAQLDLVGTNANAYGGSQVVTSLLGSGCIGRFVCSVDPTIISDIYNESIIPQITLFQNVNELATGFIKPSTVRIVLGDG